MEINQGDRGHTTRLATLTRGAAFGEGVLLDDLPHSASGVALTDVKVRLIPRAGCSARNPRGAAGSVLSDGRSHRAKSEHSPASRRTTLLYVSGVSPVVSTWRKERDSLGERGLPKPTAYYGVQTLRGMENYPISGIPLHHFGHFVRSLAYVKKAAAMANNDSAWSRMNGAAHHLRV